MKKPFPEFETDEDAERFVDTADLSEYDFSDMVPVRLQFRDKDGAVSLQLPESLLEAVRIQAQKAGISDVRFMRQAIERAVEKAKVSG